jgi:serine/threonine-protein kinase
LKPLSPKRAQQLLGDRYAVEPELGAGGTSIVFLAHVIWTKTFDRNAKDVFAVQEEIAQAVVRALSVRLGGAKGTPVRRRTADVEAYNLFLQGKYYRGRLSPVDLRRSIGYFTQAIERDSTFALAYAWRGSAHTLLAVFGSRPPAMSFRSRAPTS